jgi:hypothetical protein
MYPDPVPLRARAGLPAFAAKIAKLRLASTGYVETPEGKLDHLRAAWAARPPGGVAKRENSLDLCIRGAVVVLSFVHRKALSACHRCASRRCACEDLAGQ